MNYFSCWLISNGDSTCSKTSLVDNHWMSSKVFASAYIEVFFRAISQELILTELPICKITTLLNLTLYCRRKTRTILQQSEFRTCLSSELDIHGVMKLKCFFKMVLKQIYILHSEVLTQNKMSLCQLVNKKMSRKAIWKKVLNS